MIAPFYTDENFNNVQNTLMQLGQNIISGDIPEYYRPIGEIGGETLDNLINQVGADISKSVSEDVARRGMSRSGIAPAVTARQIADATTKIRYSDLQRALQGRGNLFQLGIGTVDNVGNRGLNYAGQKNTYNVNKANLEEMARQFDLARHDRRRSANKAKDRELWSALGSLGSSLLFGSNVGDMFSGALNKLGNSTPSFNNSPSFNQLSQIDAFSPYIDTSSYDFLNEPMFNFN